MNITIFKGITDVMVEVTFALVPLIIFFLIAQMAFLRMPWKRVIDIIKGIVLAFV